MTRKVTRHFVVASDASIAAGDQFNAGNSADSIQRTFSESIVYAFDVPATAHGFTLLNNDIVDGTTQTLFRLGL